MTVSGENHSTMEDSNHCDILEHNRPWTICCINPHDTLGNNRDTFGSLNIGEGYQLGTHRKPRAERSNAAVACRETATSKSGWRYSGHATSREARFARPGTRHNGRIPGNSSGGKPIYPSIFLGEFSTDNGDYLCARNSISLAATLMLSSALALSGCKSAPPATPPAQGAASSAAQPARCIRASEPATAATGDRSGVCPAAAPAAAAGGAAGSPSSVPALCSCAQATGCPDRRPGDRCRLRSSSAPAKMM